MLTSVTQVGYDSFQTFVRLGLIWLILSRLLPLNMRENAGIATHLGTQTITIMIGRQWLMASKWEGHFQISRLQCFKSLHPQLTSSLLKIESAIHSETWISINWSLNLVRRTHEERMFFVFKIKMCFAFIAAIRELIFCVFLLTSKALTIFDYMVISTFQKSK